MKPDNFVIPSDKLEHAVTDIFTKAGSSAAESKRIAHYLVGANLAGHDSHGVARVIRYVQLVQEKQVLPDQEVDVIVDTPVIAVVDGKYGFGQTVAPQAVQIGIDKCKHGGLSAARRDFHT